MTPGWAQSCPKTLTPAGATKERERERKWANMEWQRQWRLADAEGVNCEHHCRSRNLKVLTQTQVASCKREGLGRWLAGRVCDVGSLARPGIVTTTAEVEDGELGNRGSKRTWLETLTGCKTQISLISPYYRSLAWRLGGWSLIPNLLLISKVLMFDYVVEYMHVEFMFLVIDIVVVWIWIENG